jgi:hypothetical protein
VGVVDLGDPRDGRPVDDLRRTDVGVDCVGALDLIESDGEIGFVCGSQERVAGFSLNPSDGWPSDGWIIFGKCAEGEP